LILGVHLAELRDPVNAAQAKSAAFAPNAFLRIGTDDSVTVIANKSEMGQGIHTALAMMVAEELDADWSKVRVENAPVAPIYFHTEYGTQLTGGSSSTWSEWKRLREVGATGRVMLVAAAAQVWQVDPATCRTDNGHVVHTATRRRLSYGQLAEKASLLSPPQNVTLKDPKDFKLIGKPIKRLDTPEKIDGTGIFGIDVKVPGMLVALVARPPVFGGKVKRFDASKGKSIPGVRHVVEIEYGIAVVADGFWPAMKGRQALAITWDDGPLATLDSKTQRAQYAELAQSPGAEARKDGDVADAMDRAASRLEAAYELPYLAHATMEPLNCVADVRADRCEIWTGTQYQAADHAAAVEITGLKPEQVELHTVLLGGGFGHRAAIHRNYFVREAVQVSKAVQAPVKVIWTREDDTRGGYYRPACHHWIRAGLDAVGNPVAWWHRIVCQSIMEGTPFEQYLVQKGVDGTAVEGAREVPYEIPNLLVEWQKAPAAAPVQPWRSVGHSHNAFVIETFLDELAHATGKDPYEYRRALLKNHPRHLAALDLVVEKAGWSKPIVDGRGRGLAVHESFGSFVAQVAEVSISAEGKLRVHRVVCAADCGPVVNPDTIHSMIESGIVYGLTAALYGEITLEKGRVKQRNFHDYPMLRIDEMPVVESHIVPSTEKMGGAGEIAVPPIAPAVANAVFALTGRRIRRLPIRTEDLKRT
jgi:isoquinoline 1-oxidoreductase beta subunit